MFHVLPSALLCTVFKNLGSVPSKVLLLKNLRLSASFLSVEVGMNGVVSDEGLMIRDS